MFLITKWFGVFLCNENKIIKKKLFPKDKKEISKRLKKINENKILKEEKDISTNVKEIIVFEKRLRKIGNFSKVEFDFEIKPEEFGYDVNLLHQASLLSSLKISKEKLASEDLQIVQMINALDDLIQTSNLLSERIDSWEVLPVDEQRMKPLKNSYLIIDSEISKLENLITSDMKNIAPNISSIVGPITAARLISNAGSLEKLALFPASTIQILGAEKALFRFKKEGGKPPKHGAIFQDIRIKNAKRSNRGKIARIIASKLSIAAKADAFTKRDISIELNKDLDTRLKEIRNSK